MGFSRVFKAGSNTGAELALNPTKNDSRQRFIDIDAFEPHLNCSERWLGATWSYL